MRTKFNLKIENPVSLSLQEILFDYANFVGSKNALFENIDGRINKAMYKCGASGSHVWISELNNKRVAIYTEQK